MHTKNAELPSDEWEGVTTEGEKGQGVAGQTSSIQFSWRA